MPSPTVRENIEQPQRDGHVPVSGPTEVAAPSGAGCEKRAGAGEVREASGHLPPRASPHSWGLQMVAVSAATYKRTAACIEPKPANDDRLRRATDPIARDRRAGSPRWHIPGAHRCQRQRRLGRRRQRAPRSPMSRRDRSSTRDRRVRTERRGVHRTSPRTNSPHTGP